MAPTFKMHSQAPVALLASLNRHRYERESREVPLAPFPTSKEPISAAPSEDAHKQALLRNYMQHRETLVRKQWALRREPGPELAVLAGAEGVGRKTSGRESLDLSPPLRRSSFQLPSFARVSFAAIESPPLRRSNRGSSARVSFIVAAGRSSDTKSTGGSPPGRKPDTPSRLRKLPTSVRRMRNMDSIDDIFEALSIVGHMPADCLIEGLGLANCRVPKRAQSQNICKPANELGISRSQFRSLVDALGGHSSRSDE